MNILTIHLTPPHLHLKLQGRLEATSAVQLREKLHEAEQQHINWISLNVADIDHMDAAGLAVITSSLRSLRRQGGDLWLISPSNAVTEMLRYTMLEDIIPIQSQANTVTLLASKPIWQRLLQV